jgi:hypothetical protein
MKMEESVPKRRRIKFRRREINQKKKIQHSEHGESLKSRTLDLYSHFTADIYLCLRATCRTGYVTGNAA